MPSQNKLDEMRHSASEQPQRQEENRPLALPLRCLDASSPLAPSVNSAVPCEIPPRATTTSDNGAAPDRPNCAREEKHFLTSPGGQFRRDRYLPDERSHRTPSYSSENSPLMEGDPSSPPLLQAKRSTAPPPPPPPPPLFHHPRSSSAALSTPPAASRQLPHRSGGSSPLVGRPPPPTTPEAEVPHQSGNTVAGLQQRRADSLPSSPFVPSSESTTPITAPPLTSTFTYPPPLSLQVLAGPVLEPSERSIVSDMVSLSSFTARPGSPMGCKREEWGTHPYLPVSSVTALKEEEDTVVAGGASRATTRLPCTPNLSSVLWSSGEGGKAGSDARSKVTSNGMASQMFAVIVPTAIHGKAATNPPRSHTQLSTTGFTSQNTSALPSKTSTSSTIPTSSSTLITTSTTTSGSHSSGGRNELSESEKGRNSPACTQCPCPAAVDSGPLEPPSLTEFSTPKNDAGKTAAPPSPFSLSLEKADDRGNSYLLHSPSSSYTSFSSRSRLGIPVDSPTGIVDSTVLNYVSSLHLLPALPSQHPPVQHQLHQHRPSAVMGSASSVMPSSKGRVIDPLTPSLLNSAKLTCCAELPPDVGTSPLLQLIGGASNSPLAASQNVSLAPARTSNGGAGPPSQGRRFDAGHPPPPPQQGTPQPEPVTMVSSLLSHSSSGGGPHPVVSRTRPQRYLQSLVESANSASVLSMKRTTETVCVGTSTAPHSLESVRLSGCNDVKDFRFHSKREMQQEEANVIMESSTALGGGLHRSSSSLMSSIPARSPRNNKNPVEYPLALQAGGERDSSDAVREPGAVFHYHRRCRSGLSSASDSTTSVASSSISESTPYRMAPFQSVDRLYNRGTSGALPGTGLNGASPTPTSAGVGPMRVEEGASSDLQMPPRAAVSGRLDNSSTVCWNPNNTLLPLGSAGATIPNLFSSSPPGAPRCESSSSIGQLSYTRPSSAGGDAPCVYSLPSPPAPHEFTASLTGANGGNVATALLRSRPAGAVIPPLLSNVKGSAASRPASPPPTASHNGLEGVFRDSVSPTAHSGAPRYSCSSPSQTGAQLCSSSVFDGPLFCRTEGMLLMPVEDVTSRQLQPTSSPPSIAKGRGTTATGSQIPRPGGYTANRANTSHCKESVRSPGRTASQQYHTTDKRRLTAFSASANVNPTNGFYGDKGLKKKKKEKESSTRSGSQNSRCGASSFTPTVVTTNRCEADAPNSWGNRQARWCSEEISPPHESNASTPLRREHSCSTSSTARSKLDYLFSASSSKPRQGSMDYIDEDVGVRGMSSSASLLKVRKCSSGSCASQGREQISPAHHSKNNSTAVIDTPLSVFPLPVLFNDSLTSNSHTPFARSVVSPRSGIPLVMEGGDMSCQNTAGAVTSSDGLHSGGGPSEAVVGVALNSRQRLETPPSGSSSISGDVDGIQPGRASVALDSVPHPPENSFLRPLSDVSLAHYPSNSQPPHIASLPREMRPSVPHSSSEEASLEAGGPTALFLGDSLPEYACYGNTTSHSLGSAAFSKSNSRTNNHNMNVHTGVEANKTLSPVSGGAPAAPMVKLGPLDCAACGMDLSLHSLDSQEQCIPSIVAKLEQQQPIIQPTEFESSSGNYVLLPSSRGGSPALSSFRDSQEPNASSRKSSNATHSIFSFFTNAMKEGHHSTSKEKSKNGSPSPSTSSNLLDSTAPTMPLFQCTSSLSMSQQNAKSNWKTSKESTGPRSTSHSAGAYPSPPKKPSSTASNVSSCASTSVSGVKSGQGGGSNTYRSGGGPMELNKINSAQHFSGPIFTNANTRKNLLDCRIDERAFTCSVMDRSGVGFSSSTTANNAGKDIRCQSPSTNNFLTTNCNSSTSLSGSTAGSALRRQRYSAVSTSASSSVPAGVHFDLQPRHASSQCVDEANDCATPLGISISTSVESIGNSFSSCARRRHRLSDLPYLLKPSNAEAAKKKGVSSQVLPGAEAQSPLPSSGLSTTSANTTFVSIVPLASVTSSTHLPFYIHGGVAQRAGASQRRQSPPADKLGDGSSIVRGSSGQCTPEASNSLWEGDVSGAFNTNLQHHEHSLLQQTCRPHSPGIIYPLPHEAGSSGSSSSSTTIRHEPLRYAGTNAFASPSEDRSIEPSRRSATPQQNTRSISPLPEPVPMTSTTLRRSQSLTLSTSQQSVELSIIPPPPPLKTSVPAAALSGGSLKIHGISPLATPLRNAQEWMPLQQNPSATTSSCATGEAAVSPLLCTHFPHHGQSASNSMSDAEEAGCGGCPFSIRSPSGGGDGTACSELPDNASESGLWPPTEMSSSVSADLYANNEVQSFLMQYLMHKQLAESEQSTWFRISEERGSPFYGKRDGSLARMEKSQRRQRRACIAFWPVELHIDDNDIESAVTNPATQQLSKSVFLRAEESGVNSPSGVSSPPQPNDLTPKIQAVYSALLQSVGSFVRGAVGGVSATPGPLLYNKTKAAVPLSSTEVSDTNSHSIVSSTPGAFATTTVSHESSPEDPKPPAPPALMVGSRWKDVSRLLPPSSTTSNGTHSSFGGVTVSGHSFSGLPSGNMADLSSDTIDNSSSSSGLTPSSTVSPVPCGGSYGLVKDRREKQLQQPLSGDNKGSRALTSYPSANGTPEDESSPNTVFYCESEWKRLKALSMAMAAMTADGETNTNIVLRDDMKELVLLRPREPDPIESEPHENDTVGVVPHEPQALLKAETSFVLLPPHPPALPPSFSEKLATVTDSDEGSPMTNALGSVTSSRIASPNCQSVTRVASANSSTEGLGDMVPLGWTPSRSEVMLFAQLSGQLSTKLSNSSYDKHRYTTSRRILDATVPHNCQVVQRAKEENYLLSQLRGGLDNGHHSSSSSVR